MSTHKFGYRIMRVLALVGSVVAVAQVMYVMASGTVVCLNDGCRIVENLTLVPPLYLNIIAVVFFQMIFWWSRRTNRNPDQRSNFLGLLLISGLTFSSVLLAYQLFFVHAFCVYCLLIFGLVFGMNLFYDSKQQIDGSVVLAMILLSFSILNFMPTEVFSRFYSLKNAAYGHKSCAAPTKEVYLIFSSECAHCTKVIKALNNCNSCDMYFNPIDKIDAMAADDIQLNPDYSPDLNRLILKVLDIDTVPVLVSKGAEGYRFIKGEKQIVDYVRHACFTHDDVSSADDGFVSDEQGMSVITGEEGECTVDTDCNKE
jgi:hypothetical protein